MKFSGTEDAVSPVIGVILMVAITVILSAIIGTFVFNIAGSLTSSKSVAITGSADSNYHAVLTIQGGPDIRTVQALTVKVNGNTDGGSWIGGVSSVGSTFTTSSSVSGYRVMVIGTFRDGSSQILFDRQY